MPAVFGADRLLQRRDVVALVKRAPGSIGSKSRR